jgi:hypothetical protein
MTQNKITIEMLAEMTNEGFKITATKDDIKEVTTHLTVSIHDWTESNTCSRGNIIHE